MPSLGFVGNAEALTPNQHMTLGEYLDGLDGNKEWEFHHSANHNSELQAHQVAMEEGFKTVVHCSPISKHILDSDETVYCSGKLSGHISVIQASNILLISPSGIRDITRGLLPIIQGAHQQKKGVIILHP